MKKLNLKTDVKYKMIIVVISLLIFISILSYQFTDSNFYIISTIIGILSIIAIIISVTGLIKSIKNFNHPRSKRRFFLYFIVGFLVCALLYFIIANIVDALEYLT
ncbi:hypothetical protein [Polaribacter porphyrae]|uniref:Uncharacterized protein n=1 Tax=Polaribacter porphyrae TaxID=1137780 RepID=A0A2S7WL05_9FLAO|nr:hypothetical protein [Polaribacter porphyrae]PQJ78290.1 hypothetical protein BTO18_03380 [Polaribacter porphyrae]